MATSHRSGIAALIGRPNVGKSTLLNRLVGERLSIVSPKPQTTRTRILGVVTRPESQVAFVDTPGFHEAKGALNRFMVDVAAHAADECDAVVLLVDATGPHKADDPLVTEGNERILSRLKQRSKTVILALNKVDLIEKPLLLPLIDSYARAFEFAHIIPISARKGDGVEALYDAVVGQMPMGPPLYEPDMLTDQAERTLVGEFIREQIVKNCRQEIPYSTAVVVEHFDESERYEDPRPKSKKPVPEGGKKGLIRINANIFVERESQKAIVIGKRGQMLKAIGTEARKTIERFLGAHVFLSLQVKVEEGWSERNDGLRKLGYDHGRV